MRPSFVWLAAVVGLSGVLVACGDDAGGDGAGGDGAGGDGAGGSDGVGASGGKPAIDPGCSDDPTTFEGEATYYDFADGSGNCGFPATPGDPMVAAMNHTDYAGSAACGACVAITGPTGSEIVVRIVDRCPECPAGDIDLHPGAFEQIAELSAGRVDMTWRYVACDVSGPVVYHFKDGSNPYWTAIQVRNHTYPIAKLEARGESGEYAELPRLEYNYFVAEQGLGEGPYELRVTDVAGHVLEDAGVPLMDDGDAAGSGQFPVCGP